MEKGKKSRILVIDDEEIVRLSCKRSLAPEGYEVETAASGNEGLALFEKEKYDLVLIDLKMPGIDGIEILLNMKKKHPEQTAIIMTGYDTIEHIVESISSGAAHYLEKPFTPDTLIQRVTETLEG
ncbi:MAG: response regulator [Thermodesulfovibrionales bacterium]|nr:response regulator [Thermodesulfovibrionales bacterium]